jgi:hypothetical protein
MVKRARWFRDIDDTLYVEAGRRVVPSNARGKPHESYCSFFTAEFMKSLFPGDDS